MVAQTRRILFAKQLINDTNLSMTDVALASGFNSVRRFNETFQNMYDCPPAQLRRLRTGSRTNTSSLCLSLPYRAPYDWQAMLDFLSLRAIPGIELVADQRYFRTIELAGSIGTLQVEHLPRQSSLRAIVSLGRLENLATIIARTRHLFDLSADPIAISAALADDPDFAPLVAARPGLRVPGAWDGFEIAVRAILGQQVSVPAANQLAAKMVARLGTPIPNPLGPAELTRTFPTPDRFKFEALTALGLPRQRARAIASLADAFLKNPQLFDPKPSLQAAIDEFCRLPGVGQWTAQYIAMRVLRESDAFLADDAVLRRSLGGRGNRLSSQQLISRAQPWRPWRAYAVLHLWTSELSAATTSKERCNAIET